MNRAAAELRALSDADLDKQLEETERQLFTLRFQVVTRQTANHRALRETKRRIARLKTLRHERELAALYGQED
jgi:large subunit ribosomal protein L29